MEQETPKQRMPYIRSRQSTVQEGRGGGGKQKEKTNYDMYTNPTHSDGRSSANTSTCFGCDKLGEFLSAKAWFVIVNVDKEIYLMMIHLKFGYMGVTDFPNGIDRCSLIRK